MKKLFIYSSLIAILVFYFYHLNSGDEPNDGNESSAVIENSPQSNESAKVKAKSKISSPSNNTAETTESVEELMIEQVKLINIDDLEINSFRILDRVLKQLELPENVRSMIKNGDLLGAASILSADPGNPDNLIALELLEVSCASLKYDQTYLKRIQEENQGLPEEFNEEEQQFFQEYQLRRINYTDRTLQTCNDMRVATALDLDARREELLKLNKNPMAQLIGKMGKIDKEEATELVKQYHDKHNNEKSLMGLSQALLASDDPKDVQQGVNAFLELQNQNPQTYKSMAFCLKKGCKDLPDDFKDKLKTPQHWFAKASEFGDPYSIQTLHRELEKTDNWEESWSWAQFDLALKKIGCYQNAETYIHNYAQAKRQLKRAERNLTPEDIERARIRADELYRANLEKAKSWLNC
ncbi:hypothetical protein [Pleionea sediminis]|uniref:hypothetical protein n=1 Tax=Pleionea sediminis TaxID=2569479 RepID=UPI0011846DC5|nr:hypothetical protein [Pleionea sediminis]